MSTYVQLVDLLKTECGVSGATLTTLANQVKEISRLAGWINQAWMDIQETHEDWFFLRQPLSFNTQISKQSYTPNPTDMNIPASPGLGVYKRDSMRIYSVALGVGNEMEIPYLSYDEFRRLWLYGTQRTQQTRPTVWTFDPQYNFMLGAIPDAVYNVNGEFFQAPSELVADGDVPSLPTRFHKLIVYKAMEHYGQFEAAPEVFQRGVSEGKKMMARLMTQQLPSMTFGPSLA